MLEINPDGTITIKEEQILEPAPEGRHPGLLVDFVPIGKELVEYKKQGTSKEQEMIMLVFQIFPEDGARQENGAPYQAESKFVASLAPGSWLTQRLEKWLERDVAKEATTTGFSFAGLKGHPAWVSIIRNGDKAQFANIVDLEPYVDDNNMRLKPTFAIENYARRTYKKKEKTVTASQSAQPATSGSKAIADPSDLVPF